MGESPFIKRPLRVCVTGAECTGKTTLSRALAQHYRAPLVPEYGRAHFEAKLERGDASIFTSDVVKVAREQARLEDEIAAIADSAVIFCDTDAFTVAVWNRRYLTQPSAGVDRVAEARKASRDTAIDLYLLCAPDIPFVPDGVRSSEFLREDMHNEFLARMTFDDRPFVEIRGCDVAERLAVATAAVDHFLASRV